MWRCEGEWSEVYKIRYELESLVERDEEEMEDRKEERVGGERWKGVDDEMGRY